MEFSVFPFFLCAPLLVLVLVSFTLYKRSFYFLPSNLPPGRFGLPFIGETLEFLSEGKKGRPEKFIGDRMARFSGRAFKTSLFGEPMIVLCGAQGNKFLFSNENKLVIPWWPKSINKIFPPPSMDESSPKDESLKLRRIIQNAIKPESYNKFVSIMDSIAQKHFASCWENKKQVQVYPLAKRYTFWLACTLFMSIDNPDDVANLADPFDVLASGIISIPLDFPGTSFNRGIKASKIVQRQLLERIKQRRLDLGDQNIGSQTQDIMSHMLLFVDENGKHMSDESIANKILALLIGGHDTASASITFVVKYLAQLPHLYHEVFLEQMEITKKKAKGEGLNWEDIQKMKCTWNVASEVMRLVPPLQGAFREAIKDFYHGYFIPKGWKLYWSANSTHKNPEYFPEPEKLDPTRFEGKGEIAPYTYVPFGGGPRMCPGKEYARLEILVFLHNLVKRFKWENLIADEPIIVDPLPMPSKGLPIILHPHKSVI